MVYDIHRGPRITELQSYKLLGRIFTPFRLAAIEFDALENQYDLCFV